MVSAKKGEELTARAMMRDPHRGGSLGDEGKLKCCEQGWCQMQGSLWLNGPSLKLLPSITIFSTERLAEGGGEGGEETQEEIEKRLDEAK